MLPPREDIDKILRYDSGKSDTPFRFEVAWKDREEGDTSWEPLRHVVFYRKEVERCLGASYDIVFRSN